MSAGPKPAELALAALLVDIGGVLHCAAASEREKMLLAKHQAALGEGPLRGDAHAACLAELVTESLGHLAGESPGGDDLLGWSLRAHAPWSTDDRIVAASVEIASGRGGKRGAFETPQAASARAEIATLARALRNDACSELTGLDIDAAGPALLGIIERHLHGLDAPHAIDGLAWPRRARWAAALAGALASVAADGTDVAETPVALVHLVCPGATRVEARNLGWAMLSASGAPRLGMVELDAGAL